MGVNDSFEEAQSFCDESDLDLDRFLRLYADRKHLLIVRKVEGDFR